MLNRLIDSATLECFITREESVGAIADEWLAAGAEISLWDDREEGTYVVAWWPVAQEWEVAFAANRYVY